MRSARTTGGRVLIVETDRPLAGLYADVISTHCPAMRIDVCSSLADERTLLHDNAGGADVAICSCGSTAGTRFDVLRELLTLRPCLAVLVLIPADMPGLADEAIAAGAADVLLRAPGYLEQLPIAVRKNAAISRAAIAVDARAEAAAKDVIQIRQEIVILRRELGEVTRAARSARSRERMGRQLPLPIITRKSTLAKAA